MSFALRNRAKVRQREMGDEPKRVGREWSGWTAISSNKLFPQTYNKEILKKKRKKRAVTVGGRERVRWREQLEGGKEREEERDEGI